LNPLFIGVVDLQCNQDADYDEQNFSNCIERILAYLSTVDQLLPDCPKESEHGMSQ